MTGDGRLLKLSCLASLFAGIATIVLGVVLLVGNVTDVDACLTALEGLLATVFGVRCSILANVPSNTAKIRQKAIILLVATVAIAVMLTVGPRLSLGIAASAGQLAAAVALAAIALLALVLAVRIVKDQLRK